MFITIPFTTEKITYTPMREREREAVTSNQPNHGREHFASATEEGNWRRNDVVVETP